jgi:hypothetical protein
MRILLHAITLAWFFLASAILPAADPAGLLLPWGAAASPPGFLLTPPQGTQPVSVGFPEKSDPEYKRCNQPFVTVDAALASDDRRTNGMVLSERGFPPTQQTRLSGGVANAFCQDTDVEISGWYSAGELSYLHETRVSGRVIVEVMPRVRVYGGFASWDHPEGFYRPNSLFGMLGSEYPSIWGTTFTADYLRDLRENGDWLTVTFSKSHQIGRTRAGAIFTYKHGLGATVTRNLPGNLETPEITGVPSAFYRAILEIDDGPVTWYVEASPHVSFVSRQTGVRKHHMLVMAGLRFDVR